MTQKCFKTLDERQIACQVMFYKMVEELMPVVQKAYVPSKQTVNQYIISSVLIQRVKQEQFSNSFIIKTFLDWSHLDDGGAGKTRSCFQGRQLEPLLLTSSAFSSLMKYSDKIKDTNKDAGTKFINHKRKHNAEEKTTQIFLQVVFLDGYSFGYLIIYATSFNQSFLLVAFYG